jgi:RNA polymerase sigma factor (sigma-70 family)
MSYSLERLDDRAVCRRIACGDGLAAFELVRRYEVHLIIPVARRILGNTLDAEDVASSLLVRLLSRARYGAGPGWPPTSVHEWLSTVVTRLAIDAKRSRDAECSRRSHQDDWFEPASSPAEEAERHEIQQRIRGAVHALPQREREAIELLDLTDLPAREAAEKTGVSRTTLWRYRSQALIRMRENRMLQRLIR